MRPPEIPDEAILEAGQAILEAGRNVTGFALRAQTGGGSPARLKAVWDAHIADQQATMAEPATELPVEVADALAREIGTFNERLATVVRDLNTRAVRAADLRVADALRSAAEQRTQMDRELADAATTVEDFEARLAATIAQVQSLGAERDEARQRQQAQAVTLAQFQERLAAAEASARAAAEQHALDAERLRVALEQAQAQAIEDTGRLRAALETARAETAAAQAREQAERVALAEARAQIEQVRTQAADGTAAAQRARDAESRADRATAAQQTAEQAAVSATTARDQAQAERAQAREVAAHLRGRVEALEAQIAALLGRLPAGADSKSQAVAELAPAAAPAETQAPGTRRQRPPATAQPGLLPDHDQAPASSNSDRTGE